MKLYALLDPNTRELRYIGKTKSELRVRLRGHLREARGGSKSHKSNWLRTLGDKEPIIVPYCDVPDGYDVNALEREAISALRAADYPLTNMSAGGDGGWSDAARAAVQDRIVSSETRAKIGAANTGRTHTVEARAKIKAARAVQTMKPVTEATKVKISAALKGRSNGGGWTLSPETRARQSAARQSRATTGRNE